MTKILTILFMLFTVQGFAQHWIYTSGKIYILNAAGTDTLFTLDAGTNQFSLQHDADDDSAFYVLDADSGTPIFLINTVNERVGIRTLAPTEALDVTGNIAVSGTVDGKDIATNAGMLNENETITGNWINTDNPWAVNEGGTGAATFTDGGVLLGSGTSAITAMSVLGDGAIIVGDNSTDPVALTAFTSSTGDVIHEAGGLEADVSGYSGVVGISGGSTLDVDTFAELNTAIADKTLINEEDAIILDNSFTLKKTDPGIVLDETTASDTDFWIANNADQVGDDNDLFQIGKGTTIGTTPYFTIDKDGNVGIGTTSPSVELEVVGEITSQNILEQTAPAWLSFDEPNGAEDLAIDFLPAKGFDSTAVGDTMSINFTLPSNFETLDSLRVDVASDSTDGDSCAFALSWVGVAYDEQYEGVSFATALRDTVDLGTDSDARKKMVISGSFTNLSAGDTFVGKLWRDNSISQNQAGEVYVVTTLFYGTGLKQ